MNKELYDEYHRKPAFRDIGSASYQGDKIKQCWPDVNTVLDFGCGTGYAVRKMKYEEALNTVGYELSETAYTKYLAERCYLYTTSLPLLNLSVEIDGKFDVVYSTEVLEHIPEEEIPQTLTDIAELSDRFFGTISLRPSSDDNAYHCTLRSRAWWDWQFAKQKFSPRRDLVDRFQKKSDMTTKQILARWKDLGPNAKRFCLNSPFDLNGELEPWFFAFERGKARQDV